MKNKLSKTTAMLGLLYGIMSLIIVFLFPEKISTFLMSFYSWSEILSRPFAVFAPTGDAIGWHLQFEPFVCLAIGYAIGKGLELIITSEEKRKKASIVAVVLFLLFQGGTILYANNLASKLIFTTVPQEQRIIKLKNYQIELREVKYYKDGIKVGIGFKWSGTASPLHYEVTKIKAHLQSKDKTFYPISKTITMSGNAVYFPKISPPFTIRIESIVFKEQGKTKELRIDKSFEITRISEYSY
jgi:hypothetical protein